MVAANEDRAGLGVPDNEGQFEDDNVPVKISRLCPECKNDIDLRAKICPFCGVRVTIPQDSAMKGRSRITAALIALFLGVAGAHKFYLGNPKMGIVYILISLSAIGFAVTAALGIYDSIVLLTMSDSDFARKYG